MRSLTRTTALGTTIVVHPCFVGTAWWYVILSDRNGGWSGGKVCKSEQEAKKWRSEMFAMHRLRAKEREVRDGQNT